MASTPTRPFYSPTIPLFQLGFKRKVAILDFENKTTYKEEEIGGAVAKKLSDKLEATQRVVTVDKVVVSEMLKREGLSFENLSDPSVMKQAHQSFGIQAYAQGTVTEVSLLFPRLPRLPMKRFPLLLQSLKSGSSMPPLETY